MKQTVFQLIGLVILTQVGLAHSLESGMGLMCEGGFAHSDDRDGTIVSMSGVALYLNGSIDYLHWNSVTVDDQDALRGYLGIGGGPMLQIQVGYGTDEVLSGRLKTTWSIQQLVRPSAGFRSGYPTSGSRSWLGFDSPDGWLTRGLTVTAFAEFLERGEWLGGVQIGLLIW